jgi:hypothetical protein
VRRGALFVFLIVLGVVIGDGVGGESSGAVFGVRGRSTSE